MTKTQLEATYDEEILSYMPGVDMDACIEYWISDLGEEVILLEKKDLIRLLAKVELIFHFRQDEQTNCAVEKYRAIEGLLSGKEPLIHSFSESTKTEVSELIEDIKNIVEAKGKTRQSALGKNGAIKKHASMKELRGYAIELYKADKWSSANQAAHMLKDKVIAHGKTIEAYLSPANAQRTIAEWIRKSA